MNIDRLPQAALVVRSLLVDAGNEGQIDLPLANSILAALDDEPIERRFTGRVTLTVEVEFQNANDERQDPLDALMHYAEELSVEHEVYTSDVATVEDSHVRTATAEWVVA
jgi:hypothetical protein